MKTNINKFTEDFIKDIDNNEDLFNAFKDLRGEGKIFADYKDCKVLLKLINRLCVKSKRVMLCDSDEKPFEVNKNTSNTPIQIGLNQNGLGFINSWSQQLTSFFPDGNHYYDIRIRQILKTIFDNDDYFNALIGIVNKNSVGDLKKIKTFFNKNSFVTEAKNREKIILEKDRGTITISFEKDDMSINDIGVRNQKDNNQDYNYNNSSVRNVLNMDKNKDYLITKDDTFDNNIFLFQGTDVKLLLILMDSKKEIINKIKLIRKMQKKKIKKIEKENNFLNYILKPLLAVENL